jgi:hypothetical protein
MKGRINRTGNDWGCLPVVRERALETATGGCFHPYRNIPSMRSLATQGISFGVIAWGNPAAVVRPSDKWLI